MVDTYAKLNISRNPNVDHDDLHDRVIPLFWSVYGWNIGNESLHPLSPAHQEDEDGGVVKGEADCLGSVHRRLQHVTRG